MAYVAIDASVTGDAAAPNPLLALLMSPALGSTDTSSSFAFVRGLLTRARGEVELAVLGVMPSGLDADSAGTPLVVLRTQLAEGDVAKLREVLSDPRIARPERVVHGRQTHMLVAGDGAAARLPLEIALLDRDLVVANNARGLEEALDLSTSASRRSLAEDERFRRLMEDLRPGVGALVVYADWLRCGPRLSALPGIPGTLLQWSGLGGADALAIAVMPHRGERRGVEPAELSFRSQIVLSMPDKSAVDGWLSLLAAAPIRQMLDEVPVGGLGGFVFSVAPERLLAVLEPASGSESPRDLPQGHHHEPGFGHRIHGGCRQHGLDFERLVHRLGHRGSMQMLLLPALEFELAPAFALQAESRKAASDIVAEFARAVHSEDRKPLEREGEAVELRGLDGFDHLHVGAVDDWLVFAQNSAAITALSTARRDRTRSRGQLEVAV